MKKSLVVAAFAILFCAQAFATYIVVTKDGTRYKAKAKWTVANGRALVTLETGQTLSLNPNEIDVAKSEEITKAGMGDVNIISTGTPQTATQSKPQVSSLGSVAKIRRPQPGATTTGATATSSTVVDQVDARVRDTFERAYENVGIFEHKLSGTNRNLHVELVADNEQKVFNAISATAFLMMRNAGLQSLQIDGVELLMGTTNGGSAGRFVMDRADAQAVYSKSISIEDYFIRKVIF